MTAYEPGDVILVPYPFDERAGGRKRPALVISSREHNEETGELVVAQNNLTIMNLPPILQGITLLEVQHMLATPERPSTNGHLPAVGGRAAIYIRVSSDRQKDGTSLDVQLEHCHQYCDGQGLEVVGTFKDVESGLHIDRPQYQQALALARSKGFDHLVVYRFDWVGRDDAEHAGMLKDFTRLGIQLVSASGESPDPFFRKLAGVLAWNESRTLSIRITGSKMRRHESGGWNGKPCFGYSLAKHPEGGSYLVPNEQAPLVSEIFTMYSTGRHSLADLQRFLGGVGVTKGRFSIVYILRNQVYLGLVPHGRYVKSPFHPKPDQVSWTRGKHQPLIDQKTFEMVQVRLSDNRHRQRGGPAAKYMFSGLIWCGSCGCKYVGRRVNAWGGKKYHAYYCNRKSGFGDCPSHSIYESRIREVVIPPLERLIAMVSKDDLRQKVRDELVRQEEDAKSADVVTKLGAKEQLERLEARLSSLEDAMLDGDIPKKRYRVRRDEIASQVKELQAQLAARPNLALPDLDGLFALADALADQPPDDEEWRQIIVGTVERIVISGRDIVVEWKPSFKPLLEMTNEG
jgi:site-specific DNA recombinase